MKYTPPDLNAMTPEQKKLFLEMVEEEKEEERADAYHAELESLIKERSGGEVAATLEGPMSFDEIKAALEQVESSKGIIPQGGFFFKKE
ncbi:hypothetical protein [Serratia sp. Se-RSBMAAmG]|uniref:hypothetical protein n=1 Tax=Serratia sp. Se-RSBMAAmG TaxID=3043305 RepID=UPI0024AF74C0|nr:hypothetical protein [Serratia sp. Se-RSBMAAmG]MDI6976706.1 hypothetical protein [Serratia sp. Se-RSBMAAmG]